MHMTENSSISANEKGFEKLLAEYESYKRSFEPPWKYSGSLIGDELADLRGKFLLLKPHKI